MPRQQHGFFGIGAPSLKVLATLLFDSRGLLTISPVLIMGAVGTVLLYRRGKRAEALTIGGICLCYVGYNSGYYLPFGGGFMGPRFLTTMLPFLAVPLGSRFKRFPGPTIALAAVSIATTVIATITHPLVGYENEAVVWTRFLGKGFFQPTIATRLRAGARLGRRSGRSCSPPAAASLLARARDRAHAPDARRARRRRARAARLGRCSRRSRRPLLGIDHRGLLSIVGAGDHTALNLTLHDGASYPLTRLVLVRRRRRAAGARRCARCCATRRARATQRAGADAPRPRRQCLLVLTLHLAPCSFLHTTT